MKQISLEELLEAGCHFGHQVTRQNPKARDFVFEARDGIHIIDLEKTKEGLEDTARFIQSVAQKGGNLMVVGTKRQARPLITEKVQAVREATEGLAGGTVYTVTTRWIGGTLTNFSELLKNLKKLKELGELKTNEEKASKYTKKELLLFEKERQKLEGFYGGINGISQIPDALFIVDTHLEDLAVREAKRMNVPTAGIVDTNSDPRRVDHPIPANDDAVGSLKLIIDYVLDAWVDGKKERNEAKKLEEAYEAEYKDVPPSSATGAKINSSVKKVDKLEKVESSKKTVEPKKRGRKPKKESVI